MSALGTQPVPPRADGTLVEYRAPEQVEGAPGDARSDVFSLGVLLFELVGGVHPLAAPSAFKLRHRVLLQPAPRLSEHAQGVTLPRFLDDVLARALARRPEDRFAAVDELGRTLRMLQRQPAALVTGTGPEQAPEETAALVAASETDESTRLHVRAPEPAPAPAPAAEAAEEEMTEQGPARALAAAVGPEATVELPRHAAVGPEATVELPRHATAIPSAAQAAARDEEEEATRALRPRAAAVVVEPSAPARVADVPATAPAVQTVKPALPVLQIAVLAALLAVIVVLLLVP